MSNKAHVQKHKHAPARPLQLPLPLEPMLVDRFGHEHSAAVLQLWSPKLIDFMGLRPLEKTTA